MGTTILTLLGAFLLLLLSSLAKEYIHAACCLLALLFAASSIATQRDDHRRAIEKCEDQYRGQRSINNECLERHQEAISKLETEIIALAAEKPCFRVHYEQCDAITESRVKALKDTNADLT